MRHLVAKYFDLSVLKTKKSNIVFQDKLKLQTVESSLRFIVLKRQLYHKVESI